MPSTGFSLPQAGPVIKDYPNGEAAIDASPSAKSTNALLAANPAIKAAFGASPSFFAGGLLGNEESGTANVSQTGTASATVTINLADLAKPGELILGLGGGGLVGGGITGVTLSVSGNGVSFTPETFSSGTAALAGFDDKAFDLAALGTSGVLDLTIGVSVQSDMPNSDFFGNYIIGEAPTGGLAEENVTPPSPAWIAHHG